MEQLPIIENDGAINLEDFDLNRSMTQRKERSNSIDKRSPKKGQNVFQYGSRFINTNQGVTKKRDGSSDISYSGLNP